MKLQKLLSYGIKAIKKYNMIEDGDKIAVGISGGKDSLTTLILLGEIKKYFYKDIEIVPIAIDIFENQDYSKLEEKIRVMGMELIIERTEIAKIIFDERKEDSPCSLCAKMRKSALFTKAEEMGCNKVALGHNRDDVLETFFMSLFQEGRIHTFPCNTYLDKTNVTIIRPLIYVPECDVRGFINKEGLSDYVMETKCPAAGNTEREKMLDFIKDLRKDYKNIDDKLIKAIEKAGIDGYKF